MKIKNINKADKPRNPMAMALAVGKFKSKVQVSKVYKQKSGYVKHKKEVYHA